MNWKKYLVAFSTKKGYQGFIKDTHFPEEAKERLWLKEILPLIQNSSFWQSSFSNLRSGELSSFPVTTYKDYQVALDIAFKTGKQPFNGEPISYWAETSSTSGNRKYFPITRAFQTQFQRTMSPFLYNLAQKCPQFLSQKMIYLAASDTNQTTPSGVSVGLISNFNYRNLPSLIKTFYALPNQVLSEVEIFQQWAPLYALANEISAIFAVTPMAIDLFYKKCVENFSFYWPYLLGIKSLPSYLPAIQVSQKRLKYLKLVNSNKIESLKMLWPTLNLLGCWKSGPCQVFAHQLKAIMEDIVWVDGIYSATEGWMTVPLEPTYPGGIFHPGAHIVEFIEENKDINSSNLLQSWELKPNHYYEVFLTTAMGFVRYRLKDVVKCTGFYNRAPRLEFCYKTEQILLEGCTITSRELQQMTNNISFNRQAYWYFARNAKGNQLILVTDLEATIAPELLSQMHQEMMKLSEKYTYGAQRGEILPITHKRVTKDQLLRNNHVQTKPKLISTDILCD